MRFACSLLDHKSCSLVLLIGEKSVLDFNAYFPVEHHLVEWTVHLDWPAEFESHRKVRCSRFLCQFQKCLLNRQLRCLHCLSLNAAVSFNFQITLESGHLIEEIFKHNNYSLLCLHYFTTKPLSCQSLIIVHSNNFLTDLKEVSGNSRWIFTGSRPRSQCRFQ